MKKYALIISVIFYLFFIGCVDFTQNKNTALPDIFLYGLYGEEIEEYNYNDFLYGEGIMGEKIACSYDKCVYVKLDDTIYEIDGNDLKYVCKHNEHIFSLVGCNNCCFAYIASNPSANSEVCLNSLYLYSLNDNSVQRLCNCFNVVMDNDYLAVVSNDYVFYKADGNNPADFQIYDAVSNTGIPSRYEDKRNTVINGKENTRPIIYNAYTDKNIKLTNYILISGNVASVPDFGRINSIHKEYCTIYSQIDNDKVVLIRVDGENHDLPQKNIAYSAGHCETRDWKEDTVSVYDGITKEETDIYSDSKNRILGYNYPANTVYLYSFEDKAVIAKDLNTDVVTTLAALDESQKIKFTWCNTTLVWIYENDGVETYGGNLQL